MCVSKPSWYMILQIYFYLGKLVEKEHSLLLFFVLQHDMKVGLEALTY